MATDLGLDETESPSSSSRWDDEGIPSHYSVETPGEEKPKRTRRTRSDAGQKRTTTTRTNRKAQRLAAIESKAQEMFAGCGSIVMPLAPVTGTVCVNRSPQFASIIKDSAEQDPKVMRALERFFQGSSYVGLAIIAGTLGLSVAVDRGFIAADSPATMMIQNEVQMVLERQQNSGQQSPQYPQYAQP